MNRRAKRWAESIAVAAIVAIGLCAGTVSAAESEPVMEGLTGGDSSWEEDFDEAMLRGRRAYNDEDYRGAADEFIDAIQIFPDRPAAYRNLARSYNLAGNLDRATAYYDQYLELAGDADDADQIREERSGAVARGGDPWRTPADQRMARRALERELDDGRALTDGGGAFEMYRNLLDLDYARPELEGLRRRLESNLIDEFDAELEADDGFVPVLDADGWDRQQDRLEALDQLARDEESRAEIEPRAALVETGRALVGGDYEEAAEGAEEAAGDFEFAGWYRAVALREVGRADEALQVVDDLVDREVFDDQAGRRLEVLRATLLAEVGQTDEAASIFEDLLGD